MGVESRPIRRILHRLLLRVVGSWMLEGFEVGVQVNIPVCRHLSQGRFGTLGLSRSH